MVCKPLWGKVMKRLPVVRHLSAARAEAQYRACRHPIEKVRWHAIWLLLRTDPVRTPAQVADLVGLSVITTRDVLKRWNPSGPDGLTDGRKALVIPGNVVLHFLPPCTPELQPAEPLWPLVREAVANRSLGRIDRLRNVVRDRWDYLTEHPDEVQTRVGFRWAVGPER
jgi:hypothetical protein